ncbi:hypothetical protein VP01_520g8 [Puccinia sorghi]|uniref:Uncharacterized protein n=1 Tax=Puccinia sorghi TaxID=27349 RepID=A0A0L6UKP5_9BASI|nr:hypothetical protein VP01_520g8 [Puccinia sorghi]
MLSFTCVRSNLLATSSEIEFWATRRIQLNPVHEWALSLKTQHSELPGHEVIAPKWNEFTSALHSLVEKTSALHAHVEWEIGLFADEYKITFRKGSKTSAELTSELAAKLLGVTKSLLESVEVINVSMSESLQLHAEVYHALGASQIQIQNELRQANFIGFKYVLGSEWQQKRNHQLNFELAGLKLLQETGFLLWELKTKVYVYIKNLDVLQGSLNCRSARNEEREKAWIAGYPEFRRESDRQQTVSHRGNENQLTLVATAAAKQVQVATAAATNRGLEKVDGGKVENFIEPPPFASY